jgi:hypothetical protein
MSRLAGFQAVLFVSGVCAAVCIAARARAGDRGETSIDAIVKAWSDRMGQVRSYSFVWSGSEFIVGTGVPPPDGPRTALYDRARNSEHTFDLRIIVAVDGSGRQRFESHGSLWSNDEVRFVPHSETTVFDGGHETSLLFGGGPGFSTALIAPRTNSMVSQLIQLLPWQIVYRPFDRNLRFLTVTDAHLDLAPVMIDGRPCVTLGQSAGGSNGSRTVYLDKSSGFLPVQYVETGSTGIVMKQINLRYSTEADRTSFPSSWDITLFSMQGRATISYSGKVIDHKINPELPESMFRLEIPPGTWVTDDTAGTKYITRDGGEKRPIVNGEFNGKNFDELLHSDPPGFLSWGRMLGICATVAILAVGARILLARRRRTV